MNKYNDTITINRRTGEEIQIRASVQKKIYIKDVTIPIEAGDTISRVLPSGITENLIVTDTHVYNMGSSLDHIEVEYSKA